MKTAEKVIIYSIVGLTLATVIFLLSKELKRMKITRELEAAAAAVVTVPSTESA